MKHNRIRAVFFFGLIGMLLGLGVTAGLSGDLAGGNLASGNLAGGNLAGGNLSDGNLSDLTTTVGAGNGAIEQEKPTHTVQSGETLFQISRMYGVGVDDLRTWNQLQSDQLSVGQILRVVVPEQIDEAGQRGGRTTHLVAPGETLFSISKMYGVTVAELRAWNELQGSDLAVGQELVVRVGNVGSDDPVGGETAGAEPVQAPTPTESILESGSELAKTRFHLVKSGETLTSIARSYDMTIRELRRLNDLSSDQLGIGQRLVVHEIVTAPPSVSDDASRSTPQGKFILYTVQSGETIESLRERFQLSRKQLQALNPDTDLAEIRPGRQLTILLPPSKTFPNPYLRDSNIESMGSMWVFPYLETERTNTTTSGELYHPDELTAAHSTLPLGSIIFIRSETTDRGSFIRINDRHTGSGLKVSQRAFDVLELETVPENDRLVTVLLDL